LERAGYQVSEAATARLALAQIERSCPNFLVTDWEMPEMNGLELCEAMRRLPLEHYVYTVILTARNDTADTIRALESGADDFVRKPIEEGELLARLKAGARVLDLEQHLSLLANSDPLTGLATKRMFGEHLDRDWKRATRHHSPLSCVMLDIDFFKRVNDTYGHPAGDEVIRAVASVLAENRRTTDLIARYGGEEFCALLPETDEAGAQLWAERICKRIRERPVLIDGKPLAITASFGVAAVGSETKQPAELVDLADHCLLAAKQAGRDRVVSASSIRRLAEMYRDPHNGCGAIFAGVVARDVMTTVVASLSRDATVGQAAKYFLRFRLSSAPVVDENGKLAGFVSEKDLMNVLLWPDCWTRSIRDVMKNSVICYEEDTPVLSIYEFLSRVPFRSVVVVRDGTPTGMISRGTLLRWFSNSTATRRAVDDATEMLPTPENARDQLSMSCAAIAEEIGRLHSALDDSTLEDVLPSLVGGASRIQELVNDLLAGSHAIRVPRAGGEVATGVAAFAHSLPSEFITSAAAQ
jgi:diguanylate cyclase (GGDEF)-like protein